MPSTHFRLRTRSFSTPGRVLVFAAAVFALVAAARTVAPAPPAQPADGLPLEDVFTASVLSVVKAYPTDGTHGYYWPKGENWPGTTCDLDYLGVRVCEADPQKRCYCCGLTFEVFVQAWKSWCEARRAEFRMPGLDAKDLLALRGDWFGSTGDTQRTLQHAIVSRGLGRAIGRPDDARPGDFVQLWRRNGTGHSVVFLEWKRDAQGRARALRYWSTQKSTKGIGEREEPLTGKDGIDPERVHIVRIGRR
ncbi:MAG: hypothetical protein HYZ53_28590 [Planctomycetes bacterium]|nr:hypothetical protein [Planctomycetota bacterium]